MASAGDVFDHGGHGVGPIRVNEAHKCSRASSVVEPPPKRLLIAAPCEAGDYPVVVFFHGYLAENSFYSQLFQHVASHGFIVVGPQRCDQQGRHQGLRGGAVEAGSRVPKCCPLVRHRLRGRRLKVENHLSCWMSSHGMMKLTCKSWRKLSAVLRWRASLGEHQSLCPSTNMSRAVTSLPSTKS